MPGFPSNPADEKRRLETPLSATGDPSSVVIPAPYSAVETVHQSERFRVVRAQDDEDRAVVLKIPLDGDPEIHRRLQNEFEQGRKVAEAFERDPRLRHHRLNYLELIRPRSLALEPGSILVMEDVRGRSLDQITPPEGLPLEQWLQLAVQATEILRGLHRLKLIHRRIQPGHLIEGDDGRLRWIGFGHSTTTDREHARALPARQLESSLAYLSPEQTGRMNRAVDYRSDFYSLGITLYRLLTGRLPFSSHEVGDLIHSHLAKEPPSPKETHPSLPEVVVDLLRKLLAKNAENRYQSADTLLRDLQQCLGHFQLTGKIPAFPLAQGDLRQELELPPTLYGRNEQIERLRRSFEQSRSEPRAGSRLLLIRGAPGTGKSVLPLQLYEPISREKGHLVTGRFDSLRRHIPYSAWLKAFADLCRNLLTEPPEALEGRRRKILETVGERHAARLIELIPRLGLIVDSGDIGPIGPKSNPHGPDGDGSKRTLFVLRRLLAAFATPRHPLVVFLDNVHLADEASLRLLEESVQGEPIPHCLILAAFHDRPETDRGVCEHLERVHQTARDVDVIDLLNLSRQDVARLISDAFLASTEDSEPLARLVHTKTNGNPHFVRQFLTSLYDDGLLRLQTASAGSRATELDEGLLQPSTDSKWVWDLEAVRTRNITDNVVELLNQRIDGLPEESRDVLKLAACLGTSFELGGLARAAGQGRGTTLRRLGPCLQRHLLVAVGSTTTDPGGPFDEGESRWFRFSHERVQQAAYLSLEKTEQQRHHLRIARGLHERDDALSRDLLFETLSHYRRAEPSVRDPEERALMLELTLAAGEKALGAAAYPTAADYLSSGVSLLDESLWARRPSLSFELHRSLLLALGLATRFEQADELYEGLIDRNLERSERVSLYRLRQEQLITRGKYGEAIDVGAEALSLLGTRLPGDESEAEQALLEDLERLPDLLGERSVEELRSSPPLTDATQGKILKLLGAVATSAFPSGRPMLLAWAGCRRVCIILRWGLQPGDGLAFASFAYSTLIFVRRDYDLAFRYGRLAVRTVADSPSLSARARALVMFAGSIQHWKEPFSETLPHFRRSLQYALESGDLIFAGYSVWYLFITRFQMGEHLAELDQEARRQLPLLSRSYRNHLEQAFRPMVLQPIAHLLGRTRNCGDFSDQDFNEEAFFADEAGTPYFRALYLGAKIRGLFIMQKIPEALDLVEDRELIEQALFAHSLLPDYLLFIGLTLAAAFDRVPPGNQEDYLRTLEDYEARFDRWSDLCPENRRHQYFLLAAEHARVRGRNDGAGRLFRQAIDVAAATGALPFEALANELFGNHWKLSGEPTAAVGYWLRARTLYARWGAEGKVDQLHASHPELSAFDSRQGSAAAPLEVGLDLDHALRASRAISSEIRPDELLQVLMRNVVEAAGARRGCLLLERDGRLSVEVTVRMRRDTAPEVRVGSLPLDDSAEVAHSVIHFVSRTGEDVVLGDASASARFGADPRLVQMRIPSVLCLPMQRHGDLVGILYLENRLTAHVFTAERVALLHTLLAQAAISLENAWLYENLAKEIAERKAAENQLRSYNTELESKNTELERFTYTVSHDLRSPLVTIKGFLGVLEEDAEAGRLDEMGEHIARISKATDHMSELLADLLDLSRIGHLTGPSREIPLLELVQETLELLTVPLANAGIEIKMRPPFPTVYGDRVRLREVLQNLIENAAKFMGDQPSPRIEIGTEEGDSPRMLVIFVRDNGVGIEKEHQDVIFGLFQQLNKRFEGTGVGLALVRRIVEVHGGKVWVESDGPGSGATFFFTLPSSVES